MFQSFWLDMPGEFFCAPAHSAKAQFTGDAAADH